MLNRFGTRIAQSLQRSVEAIRRNPGAAARGAASGILTSVIDLYRFTPGIAGNPLMGWGIDRVNASIKGSLRPARANEQMNMAFETGHTAGGLVVDIGLTIGTMGLGSGAAAGRGAASAARTAGPGILGRLLSRIRGGRIGRTIINWSGKAHGTQAHMNKILSEASELVASGKYSEIFINKSLRTAGLGTSRLKPDIIAIGRKGTQNMIIEVVSPSQTTLQLLYKIKGMIKNLPNTVGRVVEP